MIGMITEIRKLTWNMACVIRHHAGIRINTYMRFGCICGRSSKKKDNTSVFTLPISNPIRDVNEHNAQEIVQNLI